MQPPDKLEAMSEHSISIDNILSPELTHCRVSGSSKKRVLELIASFIAQAHPDLDESNIFNALVNRERLGSTGIGQGIAIPHCRLEHCTHVIGALLTLAEPVSFDAIDNEPVSLLFVLLVPEEATSEHLELLSQLAEKFNNPTLCARLRSCETNQDLYQTILSS